MQDEVKILRRIGEGAFGEVSLATCAIFGSVAVKWLKVSPTSANISLSEGMRHLCKCHHLHLVCLLPCKNVAFGIKTQVLRHLAVTHARFIYYRLCEAGLRRAQLHGLLELVCCWACILLIHGASSLFDAFQRHSCCTASIFGNPDDTKNNCMMMHLH